jgi:hypothetical protein
VQFFVGEDEVDFGKFAYHGDALATVGYFPGFYDEYVFV